MWPVKLDSPYNKKVVEEMVETASVVLKKSFMVKEEYLFFDYFTLKKTVNKLDYSRMLFRLIFFLKNVIILLQYGVVWI